ncbi:MAG: PA2169 family four-helix-bundle protein [Cyclobacteriaceae bacterium]|nr:PA2169 family four-helix-bundle protein [Cyclobacteriaceae bacterium]
MENQKAIDALNTLIEINNDRVEGYETASKETEETDLKALFAQLALTSHDCNAELIEEVEQLGGTPAEGTKISGKFFRAWMDVKAALTGKDRKAILNSCEYGEDHAVNTYKDVLDNDAADLTEDQIDMISEQYDLIKSDHDVVKALRDSLVEA